MPLRMVDDLRTKYKVVGSFHDILWIKRREIWSTYTKIKECYQQKGLYKDVEEFVSSCKECQLQSKIRHRNGLCPTYPLAIHFQWVNDLVVILMEL